MPHTQDIRKDPPFFEILDVLFPLVFPLETCFCPTGRAKRESRDGSRREKPGKDHPRSPEYQRIDRCLCLCRLDVAGHFSSDLHLETQDHGSGQAS